MTDLFYDKVDSKIDEIKEHSKKCPLCKCMMYPEIHKLQTYCGKLAHTRCVHIAFVGRLNMRLRKFFPNEF